MSRANGRRVSYPCRPVRPAQGAAGEAGAALEQAPALDEARLSRALQRILQLNAPRGGGAAAENRHRHRHRTS